MQIQWYPGHMAKARRMLAENLKLIDAVVEILDARAPIATRNPDFDSLFAAKRRVVLLNKSDLADPAATRAFLKVYEGMGFRALSMTATNSQKKGAAVELLQEAVRDEVERLEKKGVKKTVRILVAGIPNVGKSTFINKVARRKTAKAEDRPGVTRSKQWVPVDSTLELLDTPGILWPKFDDPEVGKRLAFTGAIKDDVLDIEELACYLMEYLGRHYTSVLEERYKIAVEPEDSGYDLLEKAGRKRGFLMRGAQVDTERMARILLDEFRGGKLGRFTLETVEDAT